MKKILELNNITVKFGSGHQMVEAVKHLSFELFEGETLGIVGESGSGKSVSCLSILGLLPRNNCSLEAESIRYFDKGNPVDLDKLSSQELRKYRGGEIAMVFQNPMSSLNPTHRCGAQVMEALLTHRTISKADARKAVLDLFNKVQLPDQERIFKSYPHELSGGQIQRVMIAMALSCRPKILIADEPTTALDVTVQKTIIDLLKQIQEEFKMTIIFISHDLAVVNKMADRVLVMRKGKLVEQGTATQLFGNPKEKYTQGLVACRPPLNKKLRRLPTIAQFEANEVIEEVETSHSYSANKDVAELIKVDSLNCWYPKSANWLGQVKEYVKAVQNVSFSINEKETLGLVGESGSGKSTLGMSLLNLIKSQSGRVIYQGKDVLRSSAQQMKALRKDLQIIFQNPYASLNPSMRIGEAILEPMTVHSIGEGRKERKDRVMDLLLKVGLEEDHFHRYPHEFSGGQRQRVSIARTLAVEPKFIVCDECVSALDVSVQAQILNLLKDLQESYNLSYLFISHDLSVVKFMSDRIIVMNQGQIVEEGDGESLYKAPQKDYTRKLIEAIPKF